jgi:bifunctional DNA-binding transcriptional regulator/antitoxin component of YhaV-PrlF toxin-antitoxin module
MAKELLYRVQEENGENSARVDAQGQLEIPVEMLEKYGIQQGDRVVLTETPDGILVSSRKEVALRALEEMGRILRESGITLEELIESGREIRAEIAREKYGLYDPE